MLVNKFTASTAEFFTQFFKENKLAIVIGEKTYGKSELIGYFNLENGGTVFFPIGYFVSEKGKNISKTGIYPDIYVDDPGFGIFLDSKNLENDNVIKIALDFLFEYEKNK
ncbi:S41 family peptidase [Marinitoga lauensis]|uniref:S41 family peptidase n=1 Tax=Marinitoga lauensis TaxID=2201189 RepID=UPI0034A49E46